MIKELPDYHIVMGTSVGTLKGIYNFQFFNKEIMTNSVVSLGISTDLDMDACTNHGMKKTDIKLKITKKDFSESNLVFTPLRKFNFENSFFIFLNYRDNDNHIRLNIFLDTGKIHLYKKDNGKVKTYLYSKIRPFYNNHEDNTYELGIKDRFLSFTINNQLIFSKKIFFSYGKIGIGAYGKKGDQVEFIFKTGKK